MENKIVKRKKNVTNKIVFAILCLLVASLVAIQIVLVSTAYFSNSKSGNAVVTTGNVSVSYVLYGNDGTPIEATGGSAPNVNYGLSANEVGEYQNVLALMNGEASQYSLTITNTSTTHSCYARVKVEFLALNTTTHAYEVVGTSPIAVSAVSNCFVYGGIIYNNVKIVIGTISIYVIWIYCIFFITGK